MTRYSGQPCQWKALGWTSHRIETTLELKALGNHSNDTLWLTNGYWTCTSREGIALCSFAKVWWTHRKVYDWLEPAEFQARRHGSHSWPQLRRRSRGFQEIGNTIGFWRKIPFKNIWEKHRSYKTTLLQLILKKGTEEKNIVRLLVVYLTGIMLFPNTLC